MAVGRACSSFVNTEVDQGGHISSWVASVVANDLTYTWLHHVERVRDATIPVHPPLKSIPARPSVKTTQQVATWIQMARLTRIDKDKIWLGSQLSMSKLEACLEFRIPQKWHSLANIQENELGWTSLKWPNISKQDAIQGVRIEV